MKNMMMAALLTLTATGAFAAEAPAATRPVVSDAWISEAPPVARNNAAYVTLTNGAAKDALLSAESPVAEVVELHTIGLAGGIMRMQRLPLINLAPSETLRMAPGGKHIMLINMKRSLKAGDRVPLTLVFRRAGRVTVEAEVRTLVVESGSAHDGHAHGDDHAHHH